MKNLIILVCLCAGLNLLFTTRSFGQATDWNGLNAQALQLRTDGHYQAAIVTFSEALRKLDGAKDVRYAQMLVNRGSAYLDAGRPKEAEADLRQALVFVETSEPRKSHGLLLNFLGEVLRKQGRTAEAFECYQRAMSILARLPDSEAEQDAVRGNLALLLIERRRYREAETMLNDVLRERERVSGVDSLQAAIASNNLADIYLMVGDFRRAETAAARAARTCECTRGAGHPACIPALNNLAAAYYHERRYAAAAAVLQPAVVSAEQELGARDTTRSAVLSNLAAVLCAQRQYAAAEELYRRVLDVVDVRGQASAADAILGGYALLLKQTHRKHEARAIEARRRSLLSAGGTIDVMTLSGRAHR